MFPICVTVYTHPQETSCEMKALRLFWWTEALGLFPGYCGTLWLKHAIFLWPRHCETWHWGTVKLKMQSRCYKKHYGYGTVGFCSQDSVEAWGQDTAESLIFIWLFTVIRMDVLCLAFSLEYGVFAPLYQQTPASIFPVRQSYVLGLTWSGEKWDIKDKTVDAAGSWDGNFLCIFLLVWSDLKVTVWGVLRCGVNTISVCAFKVDLCEAL